MNNTTIAIVVYAALLSAVSTTVLISLGSAAHAQTQGGCPTIVNPQGINCQNPHNVQSSENPSPPVPSCASPLGVVQGGSHTCRNNPSSP